MREVLADLRPDTTTLTEIEQLFGSNTATEYRKGSGIVTKKWLRKHVFIQVSATNIANFKNLETPQTLKAIKNKLSSYLKLSIFPEMDLQVLKTLQRTVTQKIARLYYDENYPGIRFNSRHDDKPCYAAFEGHSRLIPKGTPKKITTYLKDLETVCKKYKLHLKT